MDRRTSLKVLSLSAASAALVGVELFAKHPTEEAQPPAVALNQAGYLPVSRKVATVPAHQATKPFVLLDESSGQTVFHGIAGPAVHDLCSGDRIAVADFSTFQTPGRYRLVTATSTNNPFPKLITASAASGPFPIGSDVWREPLRMVIRAYYGQRCGCSVDLGNGYKHLPCHLSGAYHPSSGRSGVVPINGGWHDAGDYGRYVVNSGITVGTLLWAWELYPQVLRGLNLGIPESGGKLPDYLAEVLWNLKWMLSLQDADGGVWHKQTSEQFCSFIMPQDDNKVSYIIGMGSMPYKNTCATADLAAVAAIAARCYSDYDPEFAQRCLSAARSAWTWAMANPNVMFQNPPGIGTGAYDDNDGRDELLWASAELWRTTGEATYRDAFLTGAKAMPVETTVWTPSWPSVGALGYWTVAMSGRNGSETIRDQVVARTNEVTQHLLSRARTSGYGQTLGPTDYVWGSNGVAANQSLLLLIGDHFQSNAEAREAALANLHYFLGRNCFGVSWLTQVGYNAFQHPHHRPSAADGIAAPWPGLLSGGPNAESMTAVLSRQAPMRAWADDERAYWMNEVAINWNAPLVFLLAAANAGAA
jgi:endoglucanase